MACDFVAGILAGWECASASADHHDDEDDEKDEHEGSDADIHGWLISTF
jgi:hypothetical protein